jgi:hypothetical protein
LAEGSGVAAGAVKLLLERRLLPLQSCACLRGVSGLLLLLLQLLLLLLPQQLQRRLVVLLHPRGRVRLLSEPLPERR